MHLQLILFQENRPKMSINIDSMQIIYRKRMPLPLIPPATNYPQLPVLTGSTSTWNK